MISRNQNCSILKSLLSLFVVTLLVPVKSLYAEGGQDSGGGGAFICANKADSEVLDLFEARLAGLTIKTSPAPVPVQIEEALRRFNPSSTLYKRMKETLLKVQSAKRIPVPPGFDLAWPSDAKNKYAKSGCQAKSVILFNDRDNSMDFDESAYKQLPNTQAAALIVHETVYKFLRETTKDRSSTRARKLVGHLFAVESQEEFNQAVAEIADFYPMAVPKITVKPNPNQHNGLLIHYPASYYAEPMKLNVVATLERNASAACTLDEKPSLYSQEFRLYGQWKFWADYEDNDFRQRYCIGTSDGQNVTLPACRPSRMNFARPVLRGEVSVTNAVGLGKKRVIMDCPVRVTVSDAFGNAHSIVMQRSSVDSSHRQTMWWEVTNFSGEVRYADPDRDGFD